MKGASFRPFDDWPDCLKNVFSKTAAATASADFARKKIKLQNKN
jgi:hypothetical protein